MATVSATPTSSPEHITAPPGSDLRQLEIQFNTMLGNLYTYLNAHVLQPILTATVLSRGSTDTNLATTAFTYAIAGVPANAAAVAAGTAFGALGTIPMNTWGLIAMEIASGGAYAFVSAAANYTTGYASEALAIAANPAITAAKARVGYVTILTKVGTTFVVGNDALAGGATLNIASQTKYYPTVSIVDSTVFTAKQIATRVGGVLTSVNY